MTEVPYVSKAAERRRKAADKARESRAVAKVQSDVEGCLVDALRSLIRPSGAMSTLMPWKHVLGAAISGLERRGYGKVDAAQLVMDRLVPRAPAHVDS